MEHLHIDNTNVGNLKIKSINGNGLEALAPLPQHTPQTALRLTKPLGTSQLPLLSQKLTG